MRLRKLTIIIFTTLLYASLPINVLASSIRIPILNNTLLFGTWTAPTTTLYLVGQNENIVIQEHVTNGDFANGLVGWLPKGTVSTAERMVTLTPTQTPASIAQVIPPNASALTFEFRAIAPEQVLLEDPIFRVLYNDIPLYETAQLSPDWKRVTMRIPRENEKISTLSFYTEADSRIAPKSFQVELRNISTQTIVGTEQTPFIYANNSPIDATTTVSTPTGITFTPLGITQFQTNAGIMKYWSEDQENNREEPQSVMIDIKTQFVAKPTILGTQKHPSDEISIKVIQEPPELGRVQSYDFRISNNPISKETALDTLESITSSSESVHFPVENAVDYLVFPLKNTEQPLYGALRAIDQYGNYSEPELVTV
ncbi:MAG TPA: hypothetical protein VJ246_02025 [Patescibacteria group bacterium]|nr:hypothetical protein [Patescibacteria group bacterium]